MDGYEFSRGAVQYPVLLTPPAALSGPGEALAFHRLEPAGLNPSLLSTKFRLFAPGGLDLLLVCNAMSTDGGVENWSYVVTASPCCGEIGGEIQDHDDDCIRPVCNECDTEYDRFNDVQLVEDFGRGRDMMPAMERWLNFFYPARDPLILTIEAADLTTALARAAKEEIALLEAQLAIPLS